MTTAFQNDTVIADQPGTNTIHPGQGTYEIDVGLGCGWAIRQARWRPMRKKLTIARELAKDKSNAQAQLDLSISLNEISNVKLRLDDKTGALAARKPKATNSGKPTSSTISLSSTKRGSPLR